MIMTEKISDDPRIVSSAFEIGEHPQAVRMTEKDGIN